eukprot:Skav200866  [mRNA]  locus=scaffold3214:138117:139995:- [translate_table: standard]
MKDALAAVDAQNGNRALHIAAQNGHMPLTKYILEQGADPSAQNFNGQTALHMSEQMTVAFDALEAAEAKDLDRAVLAQTGMRKRKQCPKHWQPERFKGIVQKL